MRKRKAVEKKPLDNLIDRLNVVGEKPSLGTQSGFQLSNAQKAMLSNQSDFDKLQDVLSFLQTS